jgi:hypothetical protein
MNESLVSNHESDEYGIDLQEFLSRLKGGWLQIAGLALLGLAVAVGSYFAFGLFENVTTETRIIFSFPGFELGEYPDKSKFSPDDVRSPEIVAEALKRKGFDATDEFQGKVRAGISVQGIIPDNIVKERDKIRASGQVPRPYIPDEYTVTLSLRRIFPLTSRQRELLLDEIISVYQEKFTRTYVALPLGVGKAFESLADADYFDYDRVLNRESENITEFLTQMTATARAFRSPRSNLSFSDLLKDSQIFTEIRLNEMLGLIRQNGLSKDRSLAIVKMDYYLKNLKDEENRDVEEEKVVQALLQQARDREQNYALGIKSQTTQQRNEAVVVDQGLVDSLLANDAYNFLVRQALDASLKTRRIQSEISITTQRREDMETFIKSDAAQKAETLAQFQKSYDSVKSSYDNLIKNIRLTYEDYQQQQYGDAVRISKETKTESLYLHLAVAGLAGLIVGAALGLGLSLLGIGLRRPTTS